MRKRSVIVCRQKDGVVLGAQDKTAPLDAAVRAEVVRVVVVRVAVVRVAVVRVVLVLGEEVRVSVRVVRTDLEA